MLDDEIKTEAAEIGSENDSKIADNMLGELESLMEDARNSNKPKPR